MVIAGTAAPARVLTCRTPTKLQRAHHGQFQVREAHRRSQARLPGLRIIGHREHPDRR